MKLSFRRMAFLGLLGLCATALFGLSGDGMRKAMSGSRLSDEEVRKLESQVAASPGDVEARSQLLGYYFLRAHTSAEARSARQGHILWLIRNRPDAPILEMPYGHLDAVLDGSAYAEGRAAWMEQVERDPKNAAILGSAASYLLLHDAAMAESLYKRAEAADPGNPEWARELGHLYALGGSGKAGGERQPAARASLEAYERSLVNTKEAESREAMLPDLAKAALDAGETAKARAYAEEMLKATDRESWNYGNAIHHGHLILGRIALREGDLAAAKEQLLAAGDTPGSPQLNSFGPNMTLARELLEKGEKQAVLEYFKRCGSFWKEDRLEAWASEVQNGKIPEFGANLDY
ncbi:MAG TPA: RNA polymerase subunit sigma-24 [Thermoanaerobaculia bacterium]|nr:RNA polymerase subunit sigma-24 [Thermoanaerobaculia bacterium]